jgi:arylsulfatase A-like enzyme
MLPREHGVIDWDRDLRPELMTLSQHLRSNGYRTEAYISHDAFNEEFNNFYIGFDVFDTSLIPSRKVAQRKKVKGRRPTGGSTKATSGDLTDLALESIHAAQAQGAPFFMWVHYLDPHGPFIAHPEFEFGSGKLGRYDSEIAYTDFHIGRLLDGVREAGMLEQTVITIVADHGEEFGDHGSTGHTTTLYDELIRVPMIVRVPGFDPQRVSEVVSIVDLAPTLLAAAGVPAPQEFRGRSIPSLDGRFHARISQAAFSDTRRQADKSSVVYEDWKLIEDREAGTQQLFRATSDPKEQKNLGDSHPEVFAKLQALLRAVEESEEVEVAPQEMPPEMVEALKGLGYVE